MAQWSDRKELSGPPSMPPQPSQVQPSSRAARASEAATSISLVGKNKTKYKKTVCSRQEINEVNSAQQVCVCMHTHASHRPWGSATFLGVW